MAGASGSRPPDPGGNPGEYGGGLGSEDSAESLLVEAAKCLEPGTPPDVSPGNAVGLGVSERRGPILAAGTLIMGRYRLEARLGAGGMGEVWAATHAITRRRVALKFVKATATMRPEMRQRFLREARAASLVKHASVVDVLDAFELEGGVPVMVMDLLTGETLAARLARDRILLAAEAAALLLPAIEAVEAAHAIGIVHRDLKPENIFLTNAKAGGIGVKVLDFGIAKLTAREGDAAETGAITGSGSIVGTPWYMAPEQCYGEKDIDQRADVWALGVILYECLSGQRPVAGANVGQLVKAMLDDRIVPIEQRVPGLAPELSRLVAEMLSRDRSDRPQSLARVRDVLSALAAGRAPARSETGGAHAVAGSGVSPAARAHRLPAAAVLIAAVGVVGWAAVRFSGLSSPRADDSDATGAAVAPSGDLAAFGVARSPSAAVAPAGEGPKAAPLPPSTAPSATSNSARFREPLPARQTLSKAQAAVATTRGEAPAAATTEAATRNVATTEGAPASSAAERRDAPDRTTGEVGLFKQVPF